MFKTGSTVLVTALALVALGGAVGFTDGAIALTANNGATIEQIDASSWNVTLVNDGDTTVSAAATAAGNPISGEAVATSGQPATVIQVTITAASDS